MPAELQKNGKWRIKKKDGTLGKRNFSSKKNALAAQRSGAKAGKKPGKSVAKKPSGGKAATTSSRSIGTGKSYQGVRLTLLAIAPATQEVFAVQAGARTMSQALTKLGKDVRSRPYLSHLGIVAADVVVDRSRMVGQSAAMSRGSVTAWAPEVYIFAKGVEDWQGGARPLQIHSRAIARETGYDALSATWNPARMRTYRTIKHGGQLLRIGASRIGLLKRLKRVVQDSMLRPIGATL